MNCEWATGGDEPKPRQKGLVEAGQHLANGKYVPQQLSSAVQIIVPDKSKKGPSFLKRRQRVMQRRKPHRRWNKAEATDGRMGWGTEPGREQTKEGSHLGMEVGREDEEKCVDEEDWLEPYWNLQGRYLCT